MTTLWAIAAIFAAAGRDAFGATGQTLTLNELSTVGFDQRLGTTLPLNAMLRDEHGAPVRLGSYFGDRPVVVAFAYYECPNLCTVVLNGLLESVRDLRAKAGQDYEIVVISINPQDTPAKALAKKQTYATRYGRPGSERGWHFLTGDAEVVREITAAAGFRYLYDPTTHQFAHASGILVATPGGMISQYFPGIEYPAKDVSAALDKAWHQQIGTLAQKLLLLCFHYDPVTGRYSLIISRVLQIAGIGTALAVGAAIVQMLRADRRALRKAV